MIKVLLVEDNIEISENIVEYFKNDVEIECVYDGLDAIEYLNTYYFDIVILDLMLPGAGGMEVLNFISKKRLNTGVIVLTAKEELGDKLRAFNLGANDYLTKPFSVTELLARVRVALRNKAQQDNINNDAPKSFEVKNLKIDYENHIVSINGEEIHLTPIEYKIIELMSKYSGRVLTHKFIIDKVWGNYYESENQSLRVFMASIRRKIEKNPAQPEYILTEVGVGYRMADE